MVTGTFSLCHSIWRSTWDLIIFVPGCAATYIKKHQYTSYIWENYSLMKYMGFRRHCKCEHFQPITWLETLRITKPVIYNGIKTDRTIIEFRSILSINKQFQSHTKAAPARKDSLESCLYEKPGVGFEKDGAKIPVMRDTSIVNASLLLTVTLCNIVPMKNL